MIKFTFLTSEQVFDKKLDVIKENGAKCLLTDLSVLLGGYQDIDVSVSSNTYGSGLGYWLTRSQTKDEQVCSVSSIGTRFYSMTTMRGYVARPSFSFSEIEDDKVEEFYQLEDDIFSFEYGKYPQDSLPLKLSINLDMAKVILLLDDNDESSSSQYLSKLISMGIYNFAKNVDGIQYLYNSPNTYRDVAQFHRIDANGNSQFIKQNELFNTIIIGVKNVTRQSGATSLVYMMKNELSKNYNVLAVEIDKNDFMFLKDKSLVSTTTNELASLISQNKHRDIIIIDINNSMVAEGFCNEVLYLIEPSVIKLQKLMTMNAIALEGLKAKK